MVASIGVVASPSQGVSYYQRDGYYARDDPAHLEASAWAGKGAEALGLSGPVDPETFQTILEGKVPGGPHLGRRGKDGEIEHRPGRDVTMSAPKSVSLVAMVGGDERIVEAHNRAVRTTLGRIEKNAVLTRMQDGTTGAMVHAGGPEDGGGDLPPRHFPQPRPPAAHSLCDRQHGAGRGQPLAHHGQRRVLPPAEGDQRDLPGGAGRGRGASRLRAGTHARGRALRDCGDPTRGDRGVLDPPRRDRGGDEGTGLRRPRGQQAPCGPCGVDDAGGQARRGQGGTAPGLGPPGAIARVLARGDHGPGRGARAGNLDLGAGKPGGAARRRGILRDRRGELAVEHLSERQAVFSHADLLAAALSHEPGSATAREAEWAIEVLERDGKLHGAMGPEYGRHWATEAAVAREWETVERMREGKNAGERVMRRWVATAKLHRGRLNEGQKGAVKFVLSTNDRVVGVQGYAGTGKTTMLDRFRSLAESAGYRVKGLAPSASAARTLGRESGIRSETLQRYLTRHAGVVEGRATPRSLRELRAAQAGTVLVVDESSLASSEQMRGLLRIATALRLPRVVLVGDEKQLDGVAAGKPFAQLKSAGMETAVMDEILRQRDMDLREAVRAGLAGEVKTAFAKLGDRVAQAEPGRIGHEAAERWLSLAPEQREMAGVIAPTRALRDQINETIRDRLIAEGAVSGPAREVGKLVPRGLTHAEMTRTENYEAGDTVIFNRRYKTLGVEKGDHREVAGVDAGTRTVHLKDEMGHVVEWKPGRIAAARGGVDLFRSESLELRRGDKVRFTRNDPASGLINGQVAAVESVGKDGFGFRFEDGSPMKFGEGDPQLRHLDRAWAATIHAFQGRTVDRIITAMPSGNANLVNQKSLYVAISRARDRADLVTDDPKRLADQLERATDERFAALDAVAEQAVPEAGKQGELTLETHDERSWEAGDALDRGQEAEGIEVGEARTGHETGMKSPDLDEERTQEFPDSGQLDQELGGERSEDSGPESESEQEKTQEPIQQPLDLDLGI